MATVLAITENIITTTIHIVVNLFTIPDAEETTTDFLLGIAAT